MWTKSESEVKFSVWTNWKVEVYYRSRRIISISNVDNTWGPRVVPGSRPSEKPVNNGTCSAFLTHLGAGSEVSTTLSRHSRIKTISLSNPTCKHTPTNQAPNIRNVTECRFPRARHLPARAIVAPFAEVTSAPGITSRTRALLRLLRLPGPGLIATGAGLIVLYFKPTRCCD